MDYSKSYVLYHNQIAKPVKGIPLKTINEALDNGKVSVQPQTLQGFFFFLFSFFFWLHWVFVAAHRLSLVVASGGYSSLRCAGFSQRWLLIAEHAGFSSCGARASVVVACRLSSCGTRAQLLHGMWDLPGPGLEPVSPALAGGFLTPAPPGKSLCRDLDIHQSRDF